MAEARVLVKVPPERAFAAWSDPSALRQWYFDDATLELRPGGRFAFRGIEGIVEAVVTDVRPDGFAFRYDPPWWGTVHVDIVPEPRGTRVHVRHDGFEGREEWVQRFTWGWEAHLRNLKAFVEGRPTR